MFDVKIYGEIVPFQDTWIVENGYCNLTEVQRQLNDANGQDVRVRINSFGGDVEEGFAIYSELRRYAKENNAKITTLAEGRCASIATVFFLAGDSRIVNEFTQPFVHPAWTYAMGDSKEIQRVADDLEKVNKMIARHYEAHTDLTYDEARNLMDAETSITAEECKELRFATEIEYADRPKALRKFLINSINMSKNKAKKGSFAKRLLAKLGFSNKILFTADQTEVDFYELDEDDTPKAGDKATIDGENADGEVVMADGQTFVFEDGTLTEIVADGSEGAVEEITEEEVSEVVEEVITEAVESIVEEITEELQGVVADNKRLKRELKALKEKFKNAKTKEPNSGTSARKSRQATEKSDVLNALNRLKSNRKNK